uniref:Ig-like domain-containing protein n=1 Tax=Oryzias latipes TaxID=8090 RepID=A0A3B3I846_ORYLA
QQQQLVTEMPPRFINPICDVETSEGSTVMFECSLMGIPSPVVSWFKGDKKIPHNNKKYLHSSDGDNHLLKIFKVSPQDSGVYTCRKSTLELKPESKRYSSSIERKKEKPVFLSQLSPASVMSGETAQLTVRVAGFPKPIVQWFHNGRAIKSSPVYRLIEEKEEYTLVITRVTSEYEGEYSCTAERWVEKMFQTRGQPPSFTVQIQPVRCSEGGEVSFQYKAQGDPVPHVKWYRGAFQIQPSRNCIILTHPDGSGLINIKSVKQGDSGLYTCKATNQFGEATCSAELVVFREQEQVTVVQKKGYKVSIQLTMLCFYSLCLHVC